MPNSVTSKDDNCCGKIPIKRLDLQTELMRRILLCSMVNMSGVEVGRHKPTANDQELEQGSRGLLHFSPVRKFLYVCLWAGGGGMVIMYSK